jgi:hypothetical protein
MDSWKASSLGATPNIRILQDNRMIKKPSKAGKLRYNASLNMSKRAIGTNKATVDIHPINSYRVMQFFFSSG